MVQFKSKNPLYPILILVFAHIFTFKYYVFFISIAISVLTLLTATMTGKINIGTFKQIPLIILVAIIAYFAIVLNKRILSYVYSFLPFPPFTWSKWAADYYHIIM